MRIQLIPFVSSRLNSHIFFSNRKMLASKDVKLKNFSAMVMYNILLGHPDLCAPKPHGIDLLGTFLKHAVMDSEFGYVLFYQFFIAL